MFLDPLSSIIIIAQVIAEMNEREIQSFWKLQSGKRQYIPTRIEYFKAKRMAYDIENPPQPPWYKTLTAKLLIRIFKL